MVLTSIFGFLSCSCNEDPSTWTQEKTSKWFDKGAWHAGWKVQPDQSIDKAVLVKEYFKNKDRWNQAFKFLKENDLATMEANRYDIDGDNLFVMVSDYDTKNPEDAKFEAHRKYADIQYVAGGSELIRLAPLASQDSVITAYNPEKDIEFIAITGGILNKATPENFFIFFPENAHSPGIKELENSPVRKIVVKVRLD